MEQTHTIAQVAWVGCTHRHACCIKAACPPHPATTHHCPTRGASCVVAACAHHLLLVIRRHFGARPSPRSRNACASGTSASMQPPTSGCAACKRRSRRSPPGGSSWSRPRRRVLRSATPWSVRCRNWQCGRWSLIHGWMNTASRYSMLPCLAQSVISGTGACSNAGSRCRHRACGRAQQPCPGGACSRPGHRGGALRPGQGHQAGNHPARRLPQAGTQRVYHLMYQYLHPHTGAAAVPAPVLCTGAGEQGGTAAAARSEVDDAVAATARDQHLAAHAPGGQLGEHGGAVQPPGSHAVMYLCNNV